MIQFNLQTYVCKLKICRYHKYITEYITNHNLFRPLLRQFPVPVPETVSCVTDSSNLKYATHRGIFSKYYQTKLKSDCIYHFPIDLEPNGRPFGSKSVGKW